ncbi:MAG: GntR family transcriptional regulator [gamma proteobacterium symbiont of Bathyaustriella thionipta]|nr:GntR family transcriptional regulator [gamma proteobacterium symbiont of Bathyaustriella thionipta]MCU7950765.1 GntR family transcriptional regulator [gamma proteobacterium symbiont of Bathyaustriella thionipta]MCU7952061.1 GntR family transcriptional regulator [gamma proteobacterium symbiont of Bathyaustriella thionipta]MCU7957269.1 GntR family transcriptional regulator [gamma proteobacterium symbiont of Bathyaustriella thionipta]MCU7966233.1 GntR family transcriptional regulator [gamma pro
MISIGHTYQLDVVKRLNFGVYLDAKDLGEVLLPRRFVPDDLSEGDSIEVFIYLDSEDRPVATTQIPRARVGEFAYLTVVDTSHMGAFLDWGLDKDVLVPFAEQHVPMKEGHSYLVYLYRDRVDGRITASSKLDKFIDEHKAHDFKPQQVVDLLIANSTELGYKAIIKHRYWGVIYKDEVFQRLSFGQHKKGFIKHIRADGKIDLSLQGGQKTRDKNVTIILNYLKNKNGFAPVHDKSAPQLIAQLFGMSKGAFKKAIGSLYKQRMITIEKDGIRLTPPR